MSKKPILVVMAAGMGSRYGGLKQIDPVGNCGEAILDFSLFDAHEAGFETAVIIIKEAIREDFMATVGKRLESCPMEIRYAYQELDKLPAGYTVPEGRTKPWAPAMQSSAPRSRSAMHPSPSSMLTTTTASPPTRSFMTSWQTTPTAKSTATAWLATSWARPLPKTAPWPAASARPMQRAI